MYTHFRRFAGILSGKYREEMSKTFVCRFPKPDKRVSYLVLIRKPSIQNKTILLSNERIRVKPQSGKVYNNESRRSNLVKKHTFGEVTQRQGFLKTFQAGEVYNIMLLYSKLYKP